jgi:hypothetical protein
MSIVAKNSLVKHFLPHSCLPIKGPEREKKNFPDEKVCQKTFFLQKNFLLQIFLLHTVVRKKTKATFSATQKKQNSVFLSFSREL